MEHYIAPWLKLQLVPKKQKRNKIQLKYETSVRKQVFLVEYSTIFGAVTLYFLGIKLHCNLPTLHNDNPTQFIS